jgi:hypothetical protein
MTQKENTLELIGENPHFELRIPVLEQIDLELIPCGIAGGKRPVDWHRLIISGHGIYCFRLSIRHGEAEFEFFSPDGTPLRKVIARQRQDGAAEALELDPGEYAFQVSAPATDPVEYTLRLAGMLC